MKVNITVTEETENIAWRVECGDCDNFSDGNLYHLDAIQSALDHFHNVHPRDVMAIRLA